MTAWARDLPHYVYRCYDAEGVLLYIGCTSNVARRISAHRAGDRAASRWLAVCMKRYEVEGPFASHEAGRSAERQAIQVEQPLFNYQDRAGVDLAAWMTRTPVARYLIEHGHDDLALATTCECWHETKEAGLIDEWCVPHMARAG